MNKIGRHFWITPGGGIEVGKSECEAYRWWTLAEIEASKERFAPRGIAALLRELLENGVPRAPIDASV